ncbi:hypothetical protein PX554_19920 [Sphingomonas sp. H39-1-10]|uniref:hypothetical protein n=1 Tax=Sphingomonas pollutisoli TaxID=3030829 RepID=UPI0023BA0CF2|nr:hypothetical protein [Sphingomonas pollutisoli]MDF0490400.1 hypothetical protein [Sphingomonas pollutisoli]
MIPSARPDNWADRAVAALIAAHDRSGLAGAQAEWNAIVARDRPKAFAASVALRRFREALKATCTDP